MVAKTKADIRNKVERAARTGRYYATINAVSAFFNLSSYRSA